MSGIKKKKVSLLSVKRTRPPKGLFEVSLQVRRPPEGVISSTFGSLTNVIFASIESRNPSHELSISAIFPSESSNVRSIFVPPSALTSIVPSILQLLRTKTRAIAKADARRKLLRAITVMPSLLNSPANGRAFNPRTPTRLGARTPE